MYPKIRKFYFVFFLISKMINRRNENERKHFVFKNFPIMNIKIVSIFFDKNVI